MWHFTPHLSNVEHTQTGGMFHSWRDGESSDVSRKSGDWLDPLANHEIVTINHWCLAFQFDVRGILRETVLTVQIFYRGGWLYIKAFKFWKHSVHIEFPPPVSHLVSLLNKPFNIWLFYQTAAPTSPANYKIARKFTFLAKTPTGSYLVICVLSLVRHSLE